MCSSAASYIIVGASATNNTSVSWSTSGSGHLQRDDLSPTYTPSAADKLAGSCNADLNLSRKRTMREYDEHDDLNYRAGSHGECRREPIDVFERGQLYNSGSECANNTSVSWSTQGEHLQRDDPKSDL